MTEYTPDVWVVLKFTGLKGEDGPLYKVMGGWYGGYLGADSFRLNSGISKVEEDGDWFKFHGYSGSVYRVHKNSYHLSGYMGQVLMGWEKELEDRPEEMELLPEDTDWSEIND